MKPLRKNYNIVFLDIDGTIVDSNHRQNAFGKPNALSLDYWLKNTTRENIFKDKILDNLALHIKKRYLEGDYIVITTARTLSQDDLDYLHDKGIPYHSIISRPENCSDKEDTYKYNRIKKYINLKKDASCLNGEGTHRHFVLNVFVLFCFNNFDTILLDDFTKRLHSFSLSTSSIMVRPFFFNSSI